MAVPLRVLFVIALCFSAPTPASATTVTAPSTTTTTERAVLNRADPNHGLNTNDYSSIRQMEANGWTFALTNYNMANRGVRNGGCAGGWFGWSSGNRVGSLSTSLHGSGLCTLTFANCWNAGTVGVYVHGKKVAQASPRKTRQTSFSFKDGDKLVLRDEGANSVIQLKSISCEQQDPNHSAPTLWQFFEWFAMEFGCPSLREKAARSAMCSVFPRGTRQMPDLYGACVGVLGVLCEVQNATAPSTTTTTERAVLASAPTPWQFFEWFAMEFGCPSLREKEARSAMCSVFPRGSRQMPDLYGACVGVLGVLCEVQTAAAPSTILV